jgi:hypothetical protein
MGVPERTTGVEAGAHQPFWACRCIRSELRRMIFAFATRTASVLGDRFVDSGVFVSAVGIISSCVGAIEPCATGCTLMGPVGVGLRLGILDNSQMQSSFTALKRPGVT